MEEKSSLTDQFTMASSKILLMEKTMKILSLMISSSRAGCVPLDGAPAEELIGTDATKSVMVSLEVVMRYYDRARDKSAASKVLRTSVTVTAEA